MNSFWRFCLARFEKELPPQQYRTWIKPLRPQAESERLILVAPNRFVLQWIRDKFLARIEQLAREHFKRDVEVQLVLAEKELPSARPAPAAPGAKERDAKPSSREVSRCSRFRRWIWGGSKSSRELRPRSTAEGPWEVSSTSSAAGRAKKPSEKFS